MSALDWKKMTVSELREQCEQRDLATTGKKQELIERLQTTDTEMTQETEEAETEENAAEEVEQQEEQPMEPEVTEEENQENGQDGDTEMKNKEEPEKKKEPIMVLKGKFHFYYNINHTLKIVIISGFSEDHFLYGEFIKWVKEAKTYDIAKTKEGKKEAVLYFDTIAKGDGAFAELKSVLESDDVKILHPATADTDHPANSISISAGQYWDRIREYSAICRAPCSLDESKTESLFNRHVVLESVPDSVTEDILVEKFPEATSIHIYPYSEACRGIRMLEFENESKASDFVKKNKTIDFDGVVCPAEKYSIKVAKWEKDKPKNDPYKPCSLEDDRRIELCKELKDLEQGKNSIVNKDDLFGEEKILEHVNVHEKLKPLVEQLKMDTNRRKEEKLKFPEPDELKNNYTKFAEAPDFARRKKQSVFGRKPDDRKRSSDGFGYGGPPHKRGMMGDGGFRGGYGGGGYGRTGGYGGGGPGFYNMVQGLSNVLSKVNSQMGGYGGRGGYGGGGYGGGGRQGGGFGGGFRNNRY